MTSEFVKCWTQNTRGAVIVVIPKSIRDETGIKSGDRFLITSDKQKRLILTKVEE